MENNRTLIVVLARNYSTGLGIIRSLGKVGYVVDLVAITKRKGSSIIAACSKYVKNSFEISVENIEDNDGSSVINFLLNKYAKTEFSNIVIFPSDDFSAYIVSKHRAVLRNLFLIPDVIVDNKPGIHMLMDKSLQHRYAEKFAIKVPLEWEISLDGEIKNLSKIPYPCFVKPLSSIDGKKMEMAICYNEESLKSHLRNLRDIQSNRKVLVQEYIKIDKEYDLSMVCLDDKIIMPSIIEKIKIAEHEKGVTMVGTMISIETLGHTKFKLEEMLKSLNLVSMVDVELFLSDGEIYFNELNLRSGGPNYFYYKSGVNLPAILVESLLNNNEYTESAYKCELGKRFVYEKVAWEDYIYSNLSKREMKSIIRNADYGLIHDDDDIKPGKCFSIKIKLSAIKHKVIGILSYGRNK